jgi:signal peptidase I
MTAIFTRKFWSEGTGSFILAILVALTIRWAFMEAYVIPSGSMLPTLLIHDHIFVNKFIYGLRVPFTEKWFVRFNEPKRGEIVVFKYPENMNLFYIKRVVGIPGDNIRYVNGYLYINDKVVDRNPPTTRADDMNWLRDADFNGEGERAIEHYDHYQEKLGDREYSVLLRKGKENSVFGQYTVPAGHFFVMGDNRDNSQDSRFWSPDKTFVPYENLVGRAMFVWLSCEETIPRINILCNPMTIRFKRFFHSVHQ